MNAVAKDVARGADVVIFMVDVDPTGRKAVRSEDKDLLGAIPAGVPIVLAINKVDRVKGKAVLLPLLESVTKEHDFAAIVPISATRSDGTAGLLDAIGPLLPEGDFAFESDTLSDKPTRFFVAEFVREQILRKTHEEVPHGVAVVVERFDETPAIPHIELAVHVDRETHKRIVIGAKGALLKAIGTDARARIEALLGRQVHLKLWVRVTPRWYESEARLRDMGYAVASSPEPTARTKPARAERNPS